MMLLRPLTFSLSSPIGGSLAMRVGERTNAIAGTAMMTVAMVAFAFGAWRRRSRSSSSASSCRASATASRVRRCTASLTNSVDEKDVGIATASNRMLHQIGASFGIAVLTAIYGGSRIGTAFARAHLVGAVLGAAGDDRRDVHRVGEAG